ncbi:Bax inhibitor-1/YccA family protein [Mucilaginibacter sp. L3T2-6]|uniref:Bax inhibitor-1/YccA family protein n=1 Tax=Mucilaginibacter sp. L3T2-6 TaxID=3062491 RepID=UPI0026766757|nr:Bax inhibitor-1/YccA family protein [Mucilaginibacter sp. L3T2-6]MDO3642537.1 Bax inhibitor-1/YccA family protein [Mucilaginibacter sp. L3T2-6]MDV6215067.1 Bax inhibitor-1/YccA family protein [Mucilaginibacter sp. L3T2-6]
MENNKPDYVYDNVIQINEADTTRKFLANVFLWMFVALGLSAAFAYIFANDHSLFNMLIDQNTGRNTGLGTIVMFAPLAFVLIISFGFNRLSYGVLALLYIAFSVIMGISLSYLLWLFTASSVLGVFLTTSVLFGVMAIAGYTTRQDLTKFGSILIMFLIGIIIASFVNYFLHSTGLDMIISYIGVAVFVGLTAYDVQKLKRIGQGLEYGDASASKMALMGGLTLYLDFINLFIFLLRIFGRRK